MKQSNPSSASTYGKYLVKITVDDGRVSTAVYTPAAAIQPGTGGIAVQKDAPNIVYYVNKHDELTKLNVDQPGAFWTKPNCAGTPLNVDQVTLYYRQKEQADSATYRLWALPFSDPDHPEFIDQNADLDPEISLGRIIWANTGANGTRMWARRRQHVQEPDGIDYTDAGFDAHPDSPYVAFVRFDTTTQQYNLYLRNLESPEIAKLRMPDVPLHPPAMDSTHVYFQHQKEGDTPICHQRHEGGTFTESARSFSLRGRMAVSSQYIYFRNENSAGEIELVMLDKETLQTHSIIDLPTHVTQWVSQPRVSESTHTKDTIWIVGTDDLAGEED